jgi:hypothetical protein
VTVRDWLVTPMQVSYAQVLGAGVVLVVCFWMVGTLALWWWEERRRAAAVNEELHLCKRTLQRTTQDLWALQARRALRDH